MQINLPALELVLGGQKSGKSRAAEGRAARWLRVPGHTAVLVATAQAGDDEMAERIARHRTERAARVPDLKTIENFESLSAVIAQRSQPHQLVVVDCLTLWLTQIVMPRDAQPVPTSQVLTQIDSLLAAVAAAPGPCIFISNEIGLGVSPLSADARRFIDLLGTLHQSLASICDRVTLLVAGCELSIRGGDVFEERK